MKFRLPRLLYCFMFAFLLRFTKASKDQADSPDGSCSSARDAYTMTREHRRLRGHSIKTFSSPSQISCSLQCVKNPRCVSTNFKVGTSIKGGECELNDHGVSSLTDEKGLEHVQGVVYTQYHIESECSSGPCQNNGTCVSIYEQNTYICVCTAGYTEKNCETDTDECASNPCLNNGTCHDDINNYSCTCLPGFTGVDCQEVHNECRNYVNLTDSNRRVSEGSGNECDDALDGWYRFSGDAGTKMLDVNPGGTDRCGTAFPGFLNGAHPSLNHSQVPIQVCFIGGCCRFIKVRDCGEFYVYLLKPFSGVDSCTCAARYCSSD